MPTMLNFNLAFRVMSRTMMVVSAALISCTGVALHYREKSAPFLLSAAISFVLAWTLQLLTRVFAKQDRIQKQDAALTVTLSWLLTTLVGSLPYTISGWIPRFVNALFESVSGFTTTGASILTDIEALPHSVLFWRSLTHWIGGIGIVVLVILVMPTLHIGGYHLFSSESSLQQKIQPRIRSVGYRLVMVYVVLTLMEVSLLLLGGMSPFESVCHAFGTISTGGFSPKNTSIAGYSPYIQYVIIAFMIFGATNFALFYYLIRGDPGRATGDEELRTYLLTIVAAGAVLTTTLYLVMHKPLEQTLRDAYFQIVSIITCTGFATADYMLWPKFAWTLILFTMFLGGCTGSTAGGIKMARCLIVLKNLKREFRQLHSRNAVFSITLNGNPISEGNNLSILSYVFLYVLTFGAASAILMITGLDAITASSSVATCMANIGPGLGSVGPAGNFAGLSDAGKLILSLVMLAGRLELYTLILPFSGALREIPPNKRPT